VGVLTEESTTRLVLADGRPSVKSWTPFIIGLFGELEIAGHAGEGEAFSGT
jgi:hypothetical protein